MSFLEYNVKYTPSGWRKILYLNWPLIVLVLAVAGVGFLMLTSVAGGRVDRWAEPQMQRFAMGFVLMVIVAMVPIWFWRNMSALAFAGSLVLLLLVEVVGTVGMGAQRWIDLGFMRLQPSELTKITLVMVLAAYYDWLDVARKSRPLFVLIPLCIIAVPVALTLRQPDLGTALLLLIGGSAVMFVAGVHWAYFAAVVAAGIGAVVAVFTTRGTPWQLLKDYQYRRIDTFLDPSNDPLGAGYHITQSQIALGSGGWTGRGFMEGTQSRLNFLPEKHTDFIFTTLAEEFGFVGAASLLTLYLLILVFCIAIAMASRDRYAALLVMGIAVAFFLYFAINMAMVMGLAPVVGVPLPLVSYGGSAMLVLMVAFGLVQSAHVHRPR
ncbi:rod shape-determining protein RodA [uncultured Roseicyclus sp.]|jgi:rod shape determining protein RodA|uniref:rod shape-determining protein RodA n=1 Tax=uncultured Roseicyclus sp. TaxID=543072 RepID=UPI0026141266|nr:rod shape-determining protein RodA [uncultured Roseicyclus sp.]